MDAKEQSYNLEEPFGKVVGNVRRRSFAETIDRMVAEFHSLGLKLPYPRGVYRFKTFEEANAWEWSHMMEAAKKRFRVRRPSGT